MLSPISPSAAQTRNNAALDSTRANSQAARNQPESTDSATDASAALEEQPPSTAEQSGPEAAQPDNTAAALTASQAQGIIADSLDQIAAGEIPPLEPEDLSVIDETDAAAAADTIGRLLARNGASADLAAPLSIIAAARARLIEIGISDENLASFDKALETLVIQRFLSATGNPNADPVLLSESRDTLKTSSFIPTSDRDAVILATVAVGVAVANINLNNVEPDETVDLSGASFQELGAAAADAADRLGRLAGEFRNRYAFFETLTELATIRAQVEANGANPLQLSAFDNAVATVARERAFENLGSPLFDVDALREARAMLKSGELEALSNPTPEFEEEIASTVSRLVRSAINAPIDTASAIGIARLSSERLAFLLQDVASRITDEVSGLLTRDEGIDPLQSDVLKEYAAIRAQLKTDGATEQQLADLDDAVTQSVTQQISQRLNIPLTDDEQQLEVSLPAINRTDLVREARLNGNSVLTELELRPIQEAVSLALQYEATNELSFGNLSIAYVEDLEYLLSKAADTIAEALTTNNDAKFQEALELFAQTRDEIIRRRPVTALSNDLIAAFEQRIVDTVNVLKTPSPEDDVAQLQTSSPTILAAVGDISVEGPFGVAAQNSFEGDNGAEPVNIFVIEFKPGEAKNATTGRGNHDVIITNVIERQLQEAEQSYELTTIHATTQGTAVYDAILSVVDMAEQLEGPIYVNLSIGTPLRPTEIESALNALRDTDLVPDELLNTPITQENFELFADTVRSIALASLDPERTDVAEALGTQLDKFQELGLALQAVEAAAAAGIDVFVANLNNATNFNLFQFANDDGAAGSITRVGRASNVERTSDGRRPSVFNSDIFVLPEQGEDFPEDVGVDAYAVGDAEGGLDPSLLIGTSFATPEMLVNAVLGRFDPSTETRINGDMVA